MRLLLLLLCSLACAAGTAGEESGPQGRYAARTARWNALLVDAYRAHGEHGRWDAAAERFLVHLPDYYLLGGNRYSQADLRTLAQAALAAGCSDPLVKLRAGMLWDGHGYGRDLVKQALAGLQTRQGTPRAYHPLHLVAALRREARDGKPLATEMADRLLAAARDSAAGLAAAPGDDIAADEVAQVLGSTLREKVLGADATAALLAETARTDPWLGLVIEGDLAIGRAWDARGSGWAASVTEDGWAGFRTHLAHARDLLARAHELRPQRTRAACLLITVAMGDGRDDPRDWFSRVLIHDAESYDAYMRLGQAVMPRWGGSLHELLALAERCAAPRRLDGPAPAIVEELVSKVIDDSKAADEGWREERVWALLDAMHPAEAAAGGDPATTARRIRRMAFAWSCGRRAEALALFADAGLDLPVDLPGAVPDIISEGRYGLLIALEHARLGGERPPPRPLPASLEGHRRRDLPAAEDRFPDWYAAHGGRDAAARALLGPRLAWERHGRGAADPAWPATAAVLAAATGDPLLAFASDLLEPAADRLARRQALRAAWDGLAAAGYPPLARLQPARLLMLDLDGSDDSGAADELGRRRSAYRDLLAEVAQSAGRDGVDAALVLHELLDHPDPERWAGDLAAAAGGTGVDPLVAAGIAAWAEVRAIRRLPQRDQTRAPRAWAAFKRLWPVWSASREPRLAAAMATAAGIANLSTTEARRWFDCAAERSLDDGQVWDGLLSALSQAGRPDDLLALAEEVAALPPATRVHGNGLEAIRRVMANQWLRNAKRWQRAWAAAAPCTAALLAGAGADERRRLLHLRAGYALMAGDADAARQAVRDLGGAIVDELLPPGTDAGRLRREAGTTGPATAAGTGATEF